jgi:ABC-type uncharacterized transport system permease subunit
MRSSGTSGCRTCDPGAPGLFDLKTIFLAILWSIPAYFVGLFGGLWLLPLVSGHTHDGSVEAAMTGAFVLGPLAALAGFTVGFLFHRSRRQPPTG